MKSLIIVSDSHRNRAALDRLDPVFADCDIIVHLGDLSSDGGYVRGKYPDKTIVINGNCDFDKLGEDERVEVVEGVKIFMCHGHMYSVKQTLTRLAEEAKMRGCSIALYGHTHEARVDEVDGVKLINPGNLSRYSENSYCYLAVHEGKAVEKIVPVRPF